MVCAWVLPEEASPGHRPVVFAFTMALDSQRVLHFVRPLALKVILVEADKLGLMVAAMIHPQQADCGLLLDSRGVHTVFQLHQ